MVCDETSATTHGVVYLFIYWIVQLRPLLFKLSSHTEIPENASFSEGCTNTTLISNIGPVLTQIAGLGIGDKGANQLNFMFAKNFDSCLFCMFCNQDTCLYHLCEL